MTVDKLRAELEPLLARLRAMVPNGFTTGNSDYLLINPDGPEAADTIQSLLLRIDGLETERERAWKAYQLAADQAIANGEALRKALASI